MPAIAEKLEDRRFLSASLASGVLTITGSDAVDVVKVVNKKNVITVTETSGVSTFDATQVQSIVVNAGGGDDHIRLDKSKRASVVDGGAGNDQISGSSRGDTLIGGLGNDNISGGDGDDDINGDDGNDRISGGDGDDNIDGDDGNDIIAGDTGNDTLSGGSGTNRISGGFGFDTAVLALDTFNGVENFPGLPPGVLLTGRPSVHFGTNHFGANFSTGTLVIPINGFGTLDSTTLGFSQFPNSQTTGVVAFPDFNVPVTGLEPPAVGSSTISPFLSSEPAGNQLFFRPGVGLFIRSQNVEIQVNSFSGTTSPIR